jgi:hypothetical protein
MVHSKREEGVSSSSVLLLRLALAVTGLCFVVIVCLVAVYLTTLSTRGKQMDQHSSSSVISSELTNTTFNHHSIQVSGIWFVWFLFQIILVNDKSHLPFQ